MHIEPQEHPIRGDSDSHENEILHFKLLKSNIISRVKADRKPRFEANKEAS
jgi:hypothetical protein